jgi:hypothetical protein
MEGPDSSGKNPQGAQGRHYEKNFECDGGVGRDLRRGGSAGEIDMGS